MQNPQVAQRSDVQAQRSQVGPRTPSVPAHGPRGIRPTTRPRAENIARQLGWFSIALGMTELFAPGLVARLCGGHGKHTGLIRLYGLREIASGLLIFSGGRRAATGLRARVAGDVLDLATLGVAAAHPSTNKAGVAFATASVLAVTAFDVDCARRLARVPVREDDDAGAVRTTKSIFVNRPADELYRFWRDFENFPLFMLHIDSVGVTGPRTSHWVAKAPAGRQVAWDSEIVEDEPNVRVAWRSLPGADVPNAGSVTFEPRTGDRGTIVRVDVEYRPPGGRVAAELAKLFNESPEQQIADDLRRFKQVVETGEVLRSDGSPRGAGQVMQRPAQPLSGEIRA